MIIDHIRNAAFYYGLTPRLAAGLQFLAATDCNALTPGRHEIDGQNLFVLIQDYTTKPRAQGIWEAHRKYIDIQYIVSGVEIIGGATLVARTVTQPYADDTDCELYDGTDAGDGNYCQLHAGNFAVFAPHDAHMPGLASGAPAAVRKAVVKVLI